MNEHLRNPRLATAGLALLLFSYPFLGVRPGRPGARVPLLWTYLFTVWALVVALMAWLVQDS